MQTSDNNKQYNELLFSTVEQINQDKDYWFRLRGDCPNLLVDAATPLFGLALRVRSLTDCDSIGQIYNQAIEEIKSIEIELGENGFDHAIIMAYRYILCSFLDEAVMGTEWGSSCVWAEHSMLSRFHNETWGGEKVYTILGRLESETQRYRPLLEFIYQCLILGFEGKYRVMENGRVLREQVISGLHDLLYQNNDPDIKERPLTDAQKNVVNEKYRLGHSWPFWTIFIGFVAFWCMAYFGYSWLLHDSSVDVINQLNQLL